MAKRTSLILKTMNVLFWIIFIGLCIQTGTILYSYLISMFVNPAASNNLYMNLNLSELYKFNITHYSAIVLMHSFLTGLKAYIAFCVVKIFMELKLEKPFSEGINDIISKISRFAVRAAVLAIAAQAYSDWLLSNGIVVPINWAYSEILFFAGVIYIIALIFKKGIELQSENELTV